MFIYDIHSHLGKTSSRDENPPEDLVNDLKAYGISKVGISSLSDISTRAQNDLIHRAMEAFPGVIKGHTFINPKAPDAIDEVNRCLGNCGMGSMRFHSQKCGCYPDNTPTLNDIFTEIRKYGVHVRTRMGTVSFLTPYIWARCAGKLPDINFFFTHVGYYKFELSAIEVVKDLKNVWVETSGQMDMDVLLKAVDVLGLERVYFGTDWPYKPVNIEVKKFYELKVPEEKLEYVFHKNAEYLWSHSSRCLQRDWRQENDTHFSCIPRRHG